MDYYQTNYRDYLAQNPDKKIQFYLNKIKKYAGNMRSIFEIGFGKGLFLKKASEAGLAVSGCEINQEATKETKNLLPKAKLYCGEFDQNLSDLEIITAFDVVEHIKEVEKLFDLVFKKLKPGGLFVFVCPVYDGPLGALVNLLDKDLTHLHKKSRFFWIKTAEENGFKILEWQGILRYLLPNKYYIHQEMRGLLKFISPAMLVVCSKPYDRISMP
ncbi:hypothetical protein A2276_03145 [candidate division WOR-1 bacterium RIFOXYA12_FULL_43_27]|uniref:Methyltransferase type 11 domain-containing protein n=1 Tax=candidate division WOR-1 bacterium RIFOXYC2_FULL_46_14 TaxID=1802587 RepID=A0A1F4U7J3_UNCSA|nr:MAG: hypothetical protein A2276_03145 [candidate division WOR-1 bacterium RIFOXYA12_FULL_43_27]OGC19301.1 MAG: hypothetical protein A2292_01190 [candidate division WOR-1 bacterium RIFOXYB2_FULL_46_45]OGC30290.1 MAG: hypothetical protein A2232_01190 [candidate division WOR-1 bacterium RIFOXYA2_FULL_46_56]OGC40891.1 MAG: hypothetical protein A2438_01190 [candidate division WOR-1 bacterium RIFOXYC2_FULL_46_14]